MFNWSELHSEKTYHLQNRDFSSPLPRIFKPSVGPGISSPCLQAARTNVAFEYASNSRKQHFRAKHRCCTVRPYWTVSCHTYPSSLSTFQCSQTVVPMNGIFLSFKVSHYFCRAPLRTPWSIIWKTSSSATVGGAIKEFCGYGATVFKDLELRKCRGN